MIAQAIRKISEGRNLTQQETCESVHEMFTGLATDIQIAAFLVGLRVKGETADEITGGVRSLFQVANRIHPAVGCCVDVVGTGGDAADTFNISSAAALVAAAAGARVAKHGNRAVSSRCGSADVFEALGLDLQLTPAEACACLEQQGFVFLFAPVYHPAMKQVAPVRRQLGVRTLFNLLGPLANPADVTSMLLGVCEENLMRFMAEALRSLGYARAWIVHGHDQSDEISLTGPTDYLELQDGRIRAGVLLPEQLGLQRCRPSDLTGGAPAENARLIRSVLDGRPGAVRDAVLLNAAVALYLAGSASTPADGLTQARRAVDSGAARNKLEQLCRFRAAAAGQKEGENR